MEQCSNTIFMFAPPISEESIKNIFEQVRNRFKSTPKVAIAGFGKAGKASLFTTIYGDQAANVSRRTEESTKTTYRGKFGVEFTDSPGVGTAAFSFEKVKDLKVFDRQDLVIHLLNGAETMTEEDEHLHELIEQSSAKRLTVVNKVDLLNEREKVRYTETVTEKFGLLPKDVFFISVTEGTGIAQLVQRIAEALPDEKRDTFIARQQADMGIKEKRIRSIVYSKSLICAATGAIPVPIADILIMTPIQVSMVVNIGFLHGIDMFQVKERIPEFITTLGAGVGLREGARQVLKLIPGYGQVVSASIAFAGTVALGEAANVWFKNNMKVDVSELQSVFKQAVDKAQKEYNGRAEQSEELKQRVAKLRKLLEDGVITQEEFDRKLAELDIEE
jgi:small GTP-binding protein